MKRRNPAHLFVAQKILFVAAALTISILFGCSDDYELKEIRGGLYRLNKKTGEIAKIQGDVITPLQKESSNDPLGLFSEQENKDREAIQWAKAHPDDPRSEKIFELNGLNKWGDPLVHGILIFEKINKETGKQEIDPKTGEAIYEELDSAVNFTKEFPTGKYPTIVYLNIGKRDPSTGKALVDKEGIFDSEKQK